MASLSHSLALVPLVTVQEVLSVVASELVSEVLTDYDRYTHQLMTFRSLSLSLLLFLTQLVKPFGVLLNGRTEPCAFDIKSSSSRSSPPHGPRI